MSRIIDQRIGAAINASIVVYVVINFAELTGCSIAGLTVIWTGNTSKSISVGSNWSVLVALIAIKQVKSCVCTIEALLAY